MAHTTSSTHLAIPGLAAVCNHTRPIVTLLRRSAPSSSVSPLATLIYHVPHTREPALWLHPGMINAPFSSTDTTLNLNVTHAHAIRPLHVAAMVASWPWFSWLVSHPPNGSIAPDTEPTAALVAPSDPISTHAAAHTQVQGRCTLVRVPLPTDLRAVDDQGWNLMHYAVLGDAVEYTQWCKQGGSWDFYLPRFAALVFVHHEQVARHLCAQRERSAGLSPLDVALALGAEQTVLYLLERGLVPVVPVDFAGRSPLHHVRHATLLMLLVAVHPIKVRRWMHVLDGAGMPCWVYALRLAAPSDVLDIMVAYLDVVYEDGGMWLPGSEHEQVRKAARTIIVERMEKGQISEREGNLILSWTNREAVGIDKDNEWALAKRGQGDEERLPPPPPYGPSKPPVPLSLSSPPTIASSTDLNQYVQVRQSHAPCPFPTCAYAATPMYCDDLCAHLMQAHAAPLKPITPRSRTSKLQCAFPACPKTVSRQHYLRQHVVMHAPATLYACVYAPGTCTFTHATRNGVRNHVKQLHLGRGLVGKDKDTRSWDHGGREGSEVEDEWEVSEDAVSLRPLPVSTLPSMQRQVARKSMGAGWHQAAHANPSRSVTPPKIEVEVPLFVGSSRAKQVASAVCEPALNALPFSQPAPFMSDDSLREATVLGARGRHPAPNQPQPSTALSRAVQLDEPSCTRSWASDDDILDVTPVRLQPHPPSVQPVGFAQLTWPTYLSTAPRSSAESNVVVISDSDGDDNDDVDRKKDSAVHPLIVQHAFDDARTHPISPLSLTSSAMPTAPWATPTESSTFWTAALRHIRDAPTLHASLARQYLPRTYSGPTPFMYLHGPTGHPFISMTSPDAHLDAFAGHRLLPVPIISKRMQARIARTVGTCALPADLRGALAQATRTHYVDRVRRPMDMLSAERGEGVYFVVGRERVCVRADELVGRVAGRPTGVHVPPLVLVPVDASRQAVLVVVRKKVFEWLLLGLGYAKPGEEARGQVTDPLVVWY